MQRIGLKRYEKMPPQILLLLLFSTLYQVTWVHGEKEGPSGYMKREYSLIKPYDAGSLEYWEILGSSIVTNDYVRLTPDHQSKQGSLWNAMPLYARDWEVHIKFKVHGQGTRLFGDGWAFWYARDRAELGNVFGSRDEFSGLGIFFDTYSNHNDEHSHDHPYISAQVNNGSLPYDHDSDGTHSEVSGCSSYFRGTETDSFVAIRYLGSSKRLTVQFDVDGEGKWTECFDVTGINLPTGYYLGLSASTGDLADNHDIMSMKLYDMDKIEDEGKDQEDLSKIIPHAMNAAPYREHVVGAKGSTRSEKALTWIFVILLLGCVGAAVGYYYYQKKQKYSMKRFY